MCIYIYCWYFRHNDTINLYRYSWKSFGSWTFDWSTSRWPHRCCEKFQDFGSLMATHFNVLSQEAGFLQPWVFFHTFLVFCFEWRLAFGCTEDCSEIIKKKSQEPSFAWKSWATCNNSTWKASILDVGRKNGPCCKRHQKKNKCCHVLPNKKSKVKTWGRQQVTSSWVYASSVINSDYWMILTQVKRTYPETSSEGYTRKLVVGRIWAN